MTTTIRSLAVCAVFAFLAGGAGLAQSSGKAIYTGKCQECHGATGLANSGVGKLMKVKPVTDPVVEGMPEVEMIREVREGAGRMQAYKGSLSEAQIKAAVDYFRTLIK